MRTTFRLDDELLAEAKALAAKTRRSLNAVVEDALRAALLRAREPAAAERVELPTFRGRGLQPGVDLDDGAATRELMERWDATR
jgi:predicted transcriptional regulator